MQIEEKYPELAKLIQAGKERGFIMYEELYENLPEEVTGIAEELDDIYMRLSELDIDVMDAESGDQEKGEGGKGCEGRQRQARDRQGRDPAGCHRTARKDQRSGPHVPAGDGHGQTAGSRGRGRDRAADRGGRGQGLHRPVEGDRTCSSCSCGPTSRARRERRGVRELLQAHVEELDEKAEDRVREGLRLFKTISKLDGESRELRRRLGGARRAASATRNCPTRSTPTPPRSRSWCGGRISRRRPATDC